MIAPALRSRAANSASVRRRAVIGIVRRRPAGRAHVKRVELILDGKRNTVQRALELAGLGKLGVERLCHFERIGHRGIVIGRVSLRALTPKIERYQRAELACLLYRPDGSEQY